ncbi:MAG: SMP-30/gluconolactonase/LRE family protein [Armatimonadota bacterium]|nr:SMP-30/gluconolactonase/LRE family protein [Armatimonadota bacterium]MDR7452683.1 SMP-30/gluconolactonase/LRE family protein [Armatimonadota bacterium]MDR7466711.1 SMP-30/gluconolactonase/LRE family protein [Armatimonadota bacterium]MDR7492815.1 SMP-30/gluconolactonase/LRE family protein [Armatimonadota bacterium]MDR7498591.1 SMP-30/gluconolactonase/LRE family protein [Armatimonadota bacterium]
MRLRVLSALVFAVTMAFAVSQGSAGPSLPPPMTVSGFQTPESVLYDPTGDVYLVSNINGNPTATDDNGFISRVRPDGRIATLKWIDGAGAAVTLNAPKGMAISGEILYVTDITAIRMFDRRTGAPKGSVAVPGSTFMNDAAAGPDGSVYFTDSGLKPDFSPSGTDAVYRLRNGALSTVAKGAHLKTPNGIAVLPGGRLVVVTFSQGGEIYELTADGRQRPLPNLPKGQLDGVVALQGGVFLVSSWAAAAVYRVTGATAEVLVPNVESPADIGYDSRRDRVLIPLFQKNQVVIQPLR